MVCCHCIINLGDWYTGYPSPGACIPLAKPQMGYYPTRAAFACVYLGAHSILFFWDTLGLFPSPLWSL